VKGTTRRDNPANSEITVLSMTNIKGHKNLYPDL
jgi:hypothetical protein